MVTGEIYVLQDPITHEIRYVGLTTVTGERRRLRHIWDALRSDSDRYVARWIRKCERVHGKLPYVVSLQFMPEDDLREAEKYWITYFKLSGCRLTNMTDGGDGGNRIFTERHCQNISLAKSGVPKSPEHRAALAKACSGWSHTDEAREAIAEASRECWKNGALGSEEHLEKLRQATTDTWTDPAIRERRLAGLRKAAADPTVRERRAAGLRRSWAERKAAAEE